MSQEESAQPRIHVIVRGSTAGEVLVDGLSHPIVAADDAGVREEIIAHVTTRARVSGRALYITTEDESGQGELLVHPDGRVEGVGAGVPPQTRPVLVPQPADDGRAEPVSAVRREPAAPLAPEPPAAPLAPEPARRGALPDLDEESVFPMPVSAPARSLAGALSGESAAPPTLADFLDSRPEPPAGPAAWGWQGAVRRLSAGLISPTPGSDERAHRASITAVQRSLNGPRTIVVLNPKGGAHKTTTTLLIAATLGMYRGGYTLAWDNNETMGTLGVRAQAARHTNTAVDLLRALDRFADPRSMRVGDLDDYVRAQGDAQFDALASDLDPAGAASIDADAFRKLHATLSRFYRVLVIDTGNNMRASNWEAAVETADQLVIVSTIREDTAYGAASLLDGLRQKGHSDKVDRAVTILASPAKNSDEQLSERLHDHFGQLTRAVVDVPYDPALVAGGPLVIDALAPATREAWLRATAAIAEGL
jgi:MinD-like ATPase involved in chromosome partitioning or flagellar assembly